MRRFRVRFVVAATVVAAATAPAVPAAATTSDTTSDDEVTVTSTDANSTENSAVTDATSDDDPAVDAPGSSGDPLVDRYNSLAEAMLTWNAVSSGHTLESFLANDSAFAASVVAPPGALDLSDVGSLGDLRDRLDLSGVTLNVAGLDSFDDFYGEFASKSNTLEGAMALQSATFATELGSLRVPELSQLSVPELSVPALQSPGGIDPQMMSQIPAEGLAFGLFMNSSITELMSSHPDVFAQVAASGHGTPASFDAFRESMMAAGTSVGSDLSQMPMPCLAEMMQAMGTGQATSSTPGCAPCATAGAYLHQGAFALLDPDRNTALPGPGATPSLDGMQPWLSDALVDASPQLSSQLNATVNPASVTNACASSSSASSNTLATTLPGVFANLGTPTQTSELSSSLPGVFANLQGSSPSQVQAPQVSAPQSPSPQVSSSATQATVTLPGVFANLQGPR